MIRGGYVLQPRIIKESSIAVAPPHVREIWSYLIREANSSDARYAGFFIQRGQLFRDYKTIREDLAWFVGYRKVTYNENQIKKAMKYLRDGGRITTLKKLGGVLITICNYGHYQCPGNYERTKGGTHESTNAEPIQNQSISHTNKKKKNIKNEKKNIEERKRDFAHSLELFSNEYSKEMLIDFQGYWTERNPNGRKMRFEKEKVFDIARRLASWNKRADNNERIKRSYKRNTFECVESTEAMQGAIRDLRS